MEGLWAGIRDSEFDYSLTTRIAPTTFIITIYPTYNVGRFESP